jgi:Mechanosensitive ion channel
MEDFPSWIPRTGPGAWNRCPPRVPPRRIARGRRLLLIGLGALTVCGAGAPAADAPPFLLTGEQVIRILDDTVDWYRALGTQQQNATQPSELLVLFANRQTADKVMGLAFDIARANAELLSSAATSGSGTPTQTLNQQQAQIEAQRQSIQQEMASDRQKLATAGRGSEAIEATLSELQGELEMVSARKNLLDTMTEFINSSDPKAADVAALKTQIDAIAATVPVSGSVGTAPAAPVAGASNPATGPSAAAPAGAEPARRGILDLIGNVLQQRNKIASIDSVDQRTVALADTFRSLSAGPLAQLKAYEATSDALATQADHADSGSLKDLRGQFDTLAWRFKQTSQILLPLGREQVLLGQYRHNLAKWHDSADRQYHDALVALGVRLGILAAILIVVFALGEVWRRAVVRYVLDSHRRYQILLARTIVMWTIVVAVVCVSFVTQISTFATFAGLLTAGLAVALQSVLVSVVGYFFLIGKYGIRVGDRVQIGTVVGEVLDIGLVRMHLREINPLGPPGHTGRIVAFANLIVFQASGGIFKQSPSDKLVWHETTLTLPVVRDYAALKAELLSAITGVVGEFAARGAGGAATAAPQISMRLANGRMEALIRYPVEVDQAAQLDEWVAEAVLKVTAAHTPAA